MEDLIKGCFGLDIFVIKMDTKYIFMNKKHIHFIGICGVAMSAIALAFHKKGWKVTGSDKGFYPPVSTHLDNAGVEYYPGWHVEKMTKDGDPDLVVVGNVAGSTNSEWVYVQKNGLEYKSYPEVIAEYFVKPKSIVCAGTYGKTSTSALLSFILKDNNRDPSYMFGGLALGQMDSAKIGEGDYSIMEGDEYKTARWDKRPKFKLYSPTHLLLTAVSWDHADIYKTEESYFQEFRDLVRMVPKDGLIVACSGNEKVMETVELSDCPIVTYGSSDTSMYQWKNISQSTKGLRFEIKKGSKSFIISSPMLGTYMAENITGAFAMAMEIGMDENSITASVAKFEGMKRRLERRLDKEIKVFDDIAHSPEKAKSALDNLRTVYTGKIIAVFEPNSGNRTKESIPQYANAFLATDEVIIPRLTKIKLDLSDTETPFDGEKLAKVISKTHKSVRCIEDDEELVSQLVSSVRSGDVIVFLGSHGFRGMIESTITELND